LASNEREAKIIVFIQEGKRQRPWAKIASGFTWRYIYCRHRHFFGMGYCYINSVTLWACGISNGWQRLALELPVTPTIKNENEIMKKTLIFFAAILFGKALFAQTESEKLIKKLQDCSKISDWKCVIENTTALKTLNTVSSDQINFTLATANFELTKFDDAKFYLAGAIAVNPQNPEYYYLKGKLFAIDGDRANAAISFSQALKLQPAQKDFQTSIDYMNNKSITDQQIREVYSCQFCRTLYENEKKREADGAASVTSQYVSFKPYEEFKNLLPCKLNIDKQQKSGQSAIFWAVFGDDIRFVNDLIKSGAKLNLKSDVGFTPLLTAVTRKVEKAEVVKILLANGASPFVMDITKKDALYYAKQKGYTSSAALISDAIEKSKPVSLDELKERAEYYLVHTEYAKAINDFTAALKFGRSKETLFTERGMCYREMKKFDLAIADFTESLVTSPYNGELYVLRGLCYFENGNKTSAETDFAKAIQFNPKLAEPIEKEKTRIAATK
jgi:tetratricopeptide (TPR) repeat protein